MGVAQRRLAFLALIVIPCCLVTANVEGSHAPPDGYNDNAGLHASNPGLHTSNHYDDSDTNARNLGNRESVSASLDGQQELRGDMGDPEGTYDDVGTHTDDRPLLEYADELPYDDVGEVGSYDVDVSPRGGGYDHYSGLRSSKWVGSPVALLQTTPGGVLQLFYEILNSGLPIHSNPTILNWGRAVSIDNGRTWKLRDGHFLNASKLGLEPTTSINAGGIIKHPTKTPPSYVIAFASYAKNMRSESIVHTRLADDRFGIDAQGGYKEEGISPSLFAYEGEVYVVHLVVQNSCLLVVAKAAAKAGIEGALKLPIKDCRSPHFFQLDKDRFVLIMTVKRIDDSFYTTVYWIGSMEKAETNLRFNPRGDTLKATGTLDFGPGAQDFRFARIDDKIMAIGWNGVEYVAGSANTTARVLLRRVSLDSVSSLLKQEPWVGVGEWTYVALFTWLTPGFPQSLDLSESEIPGEGPVSFVLEFKDLQPTTGNLDISFWNELGNELTITLSRSFPTDIKDLPGSFTNSSGASTEESVSISVSGSSVHADVVMGPIRKVFSESQRMEIVLDESNLQIYGESGLLVCTVPYERQHDTPLSRVDIAAENIIRLTAKVMRTPPSTAAR